jgi:hypothetical protein
MEDGGSRLLLNVGIFVPDYTASHPRIFIVTDVKASNSSEGVSKYILRQKLEFTETGNGC